MIISAVYFTIFLNSRFSKDIISMLEPISLKPSTNEFCHPNDNFLCCCCRHRIPRGHYAPMTELLAAGRKHFPHFSDFFFSVLIFAHSANPLIPSFIRVFFLDNSWQCTNAVSQSVLSFFHPESWQVIVMSLNNRYHISVVIRLYRHLSIHYHYVITISSTLINILLFHYRFMPRFRQIFTEFIRLYHVIFKFISLSALLSFPLAPHQSLFSPYQHVQNLPPLFSYFPVSKIHTL